MEDKNSRILKLQLVCTSPAAVRTSLKAYMFSAPNIDLLHDSLHAAIQHDKLEAAKLLANVIQLTAKKEERLKVWEEILTKDALDRASAKHLSWEKYFAEDIQRRKKKNEKVRNESILHLYKAKKISLFKAKHYPKIFFTLLKLGADPFEKTNFSKTLTLSILKSKKLDKSSRLHILEHMAKKKLLRLDPGGRYSMSPIEVCVVNRLQCLKFIVQAPDIENVKIITNTNVLTYLQSHAYKVMKYFSVEQLVKMLGETHHDQLVATMFDISHQLRDSYNFIMALKELAKNPKLLPELKKINGADERIFSAFYFSGKSAPDDDFLTTEMKKLDPNEFSGNTSFDIAELPAELLGMITMRLGAEDQVRLFSTSKALKEMMTDYHWQQMLKYDYPMLYRQLEFDTKSTWRDKAASKIKSGFNWKYGKGVVKKLRTPPSPVQIDPKHIDEYWLASTMGKKLRLWSLANGAQKVIKLKNQATQIQFLKTSPYEPPSFIFRSLYTTPTFGFWINNQLYELSYYDHIKSQDAFLADLSDNRLFIGANHIYDINLGKTFLGNLQPDLQLISAKYSPFNNMIITRANNRKIIIMDKELNTMVESDTLEVRVPDNHKLANSKMEIIDEYTVLSVHNEASVVFDIRTMKPLLNIATNLRYNGAGRGIEMCAMRAGIVWNLKTLASEGCIVLPNNTCTSQTDFVCNSKLAVFSTYATYTLKGLLF